MYWKDETPIIINTGKNVLKYFKEAEKLQVCMPYWLNGEGEEKQGKTVALNIAALYGSNVKTLKNARDIFADIVNSLEEQIRCDNGRY